MDFQFLRAGNRNGCDSVAAIQILGKRRYKNGLFPQRENQSATCVSFANPCKCFEIDAKLPTILPQHFCSYYTVCNIMTMTKAKDIWCVTLSDADIMKKSPIDNGIYIHLCRQIGIMTQYFECFLLYLSAMFKQ